jgi:hypothetical protein
LRALLGALVGNVCSLALKFGALVGKFGAFCTCKQQIPCGIPPP